MLRADAARQKAFDVVFAAIDELNPELPESARLEKTSDTVLFGRDGKLDSLGLVRLIVSVEAGLSAAFGVAIALADERAMSQRQSPFRTVATLVDYAVSLLPE